MITEEEIQNKIDQVRKEIEKNNSDAEKLLDYLKTQREKALEEEEAEERMLKLEKGIVVGQHIPALPSKLDIDPSIITNFGLYSKGLIIAKDLVHQNKTNYLRRTGNMPIHPSLDNSIRNESRSLENMEEEAPHYLSLTHSTDIRNRRVTERFENTISDIKSKKTVNFKLEGEEPIRSKRNKAKDLSSNEKMENEQILKSLSHKMNYLRNPRNDPSTVMKTLVKKTPLASRSSKNQLQAFSAATTAGASSSTPASSGSMPLFVAEPKSVLFMDYQIGETYSQPISFRNISAISRSLRVLPFEKSSAFQVGSIKYPSSSKAGMIAPGIHVSSVVYFKPTSLEDYNDLLVVDTEGGSIEVQIKAQREPPNLNIPSNLNVGSCLIGDSLRVSVSCSNTGGRGSFFLYEGVAPSLDIFQEEGTPQACMRMPPFTVYPLRFTLDKNQSTSITIEFVPLDLGGFEQSFSILCDNGQSRQFTLLGQSREVVLHPTAINDSPFDASQSLLDDLYFETQEMGIDYTQSVAMVNESGLPIEYEWVWLDRKATDLDQAGQGKIAHREKSIHESLSNHDNPFEQKEDSLSISMIDPDHESQDPLENRSVADDFEVVPSRGVLPADGAETFSIHYHPRKEDFVAKRLVMMIKSIPAAALPSPHQRLYLDKLRWEGHGPFHRLRSWLEEIGFTSNVEPYQHFNGSIVHQKALVSMRMIFNLLKSQVPSGRGFEEEVLKAQYRIKRLLGDYLKLKSRQSDPLAAGESSVVPESDDSLPVRIYWLDENEAVENDDGGDQPDTGKVTPYHDMSILTSSLTAQDILEEQQEEIEEFLSEEERKRLDPQTIFLKHKEKKLMNHLWLDPLHTLCLLQNELCDLLDQQVQHEAVEYIKECALNHFAGPNFLVFGDSKPSKIMVSPPTLAIGGDLPIGKSWEGQFNLINASASIAELMVDVKNIMFKKEHVHPTVDALDIESRITTQYAYLVENNSAFEIKFDSERLLVMPRSTDCLHVRLCFLSLGRFEVRIPLRCKNSLALVETLSLTAFVAGPHIRFDSSELDLGLIGVGNESTKIITFSNESDVPAMFVMKPTLHLDMSIYSRSGTDGVGGGSSSSKPNSQRDGSSNGGGGGPSLSRQNSSRDVLSRQSTSRSEDFSVADSNATSTDFKIELKNALVTIDPPSGILGPSETCSVSVVCKAGKIPQRIRGLIESRLFDSAGKVEVSSQYINMRGEVQAPKTIMYPMSVALGVVYLGIPVSFDIFIENICNLPTNYKLARPGGESSLYSLSFDAPKGPLGAKEKKKVRCTFASKSIGLIDDVISNKLYGVKVPLGFALKAHSKGISVEVVRVFSPTDIPRPLRDASDTGLLIDFTPPDPAPVEPLELGKQVPLYERRTVQFALRNLSPITTPFELRLKKFYVVEKQTRRGSVTSSAASLASLASSVTQEPRSDMILQPHEDGENKFQSAAGKKYIGAHVKRQEDKKFLRSGLGASYLIDKPQGQLEPWQVEVVTLHAFNDIPGDYDDEVECTFYEGDIAKKVYIPVHMSVVGCPINIVMNSIGMSEFRSEDNPKLDGKPMLHVGNAAQHTEPLVRYFSVKNNGSKPGKLRWQLKGLSSKSNGPLKTSLEVDGEGKLVFHYSFWEDIAKDSPFQVEPMNEIIPPYGTKSFKTTLFRTSTVGQESAMLTGKITFDGLGQDEEDASSDEDAEGSPDVILEANAEAPSATTNHGDTPLKSNKFEINLILRGTLHKPTLLIDKTYLIAGDPNEASTDAFAVNIKSTSASLFASRTGDVECFKPITITNPQSYLMKLSLKTDGPYLLSEDIDPSPPKREAGKQTRWNPPLAGPAISSTGDGDGSINSLNMSKLGSQSLATSASHNNRTNAKEILALELLPNESKSLRVCFNMKKGVRNTLLKTFGTEAGQPTEQKGQMLISFSTGQSLAIPLVTRIATPYLIGSAPLLSFGVCHVTQSCQGLFLLSNPTSVPAKWTVTHVPGGGSWKKKTGIRVQGMVEVSEEDDPSVFEVTPDHGSVNGPTVSVNAALFAPSKDQNRIAQNYVVAQKLVESSWQKGTLGLKETLEEKFLSQDRKSEADSLYPMPLQIFFKPKSNKSYSSRFRFHCELSNSFDLILKGQGTFEEHEHNPINPQPKV